MLILSITILLFSCAKAFSAPAAQGIASRSFSADFILQHSSINGHVTGRMYYDATYNNTGAIRWDYDIQFPGASASLIQIDVFPVDPLNIAKGGGVSYLYCDTGLCQSTLLANQIVPLFYPTTSSGSGSGVSAARFFGRSNCKSYTPTNNASFYPTVQTLYWEDNIGPCKIQMTASNGDISIIDFLNSNTGVAYLPSGQIGGKYQIPVSGISPISTVAIPASTFVPLSSWKCPQPTCQTIANIWVAIDESGSISGSDFSLEVSFARDIGGLFAFGDTGVIMGASKFQGDAVLISAFTQNAVTYNNSWKYVSQRAGSTCIPCGLKIGYDQWETQIGSPSGTFHARLGFANIFIVITDGQNNVIANYPFDSMANAGTTIRNLPATVIAIGVGPAPSQSELLLLTGSSNLILRPSTFSDLKTELQSIVALTCTLPPTSQCGFGCKGFCACNQVCICPDLCDDNQVCTLDDCTPGQGGNGCTYNPYLCDDGNACTVDTCTNGPGQAAAGCNYANNPSCFLGCATCSDGDPCTLDSCNSTGCVFTPLPSVYCDDNNNCTADSCVPFAGCKHADVSDQCDDKNACTQNDCNSLLGCQFSPLDCGSVPPFSFFAGDCQQALCENVPPVASNRAPGCYLTSFENARVDKCGICNGDNSSCAKGVGAGASAGIGIGGLLGIIFGIAILVAFGVFTGKKGYDYYQGLGNNWSDAQNNPLHTTNPNRGTNMLYEE